jgi:ATP-dependent DNA helicase RecQ
MQWRDEDAVAATLEAWGGSAPVEALLDQLRSQLDAPHLDTAWLERVVAGSDALERRDGHVVTTAEEPGGEAPVSALRWVAVDFESVPLTGDDGQLVRVPWQVGAVRGGEPDWAAAHAGVDEFIACGDQLNVAAVADERIRHAAASGCSRDEVAAALAECVAGADVVVGHNAHEVDGPLLAELLRLADAACPPVADTLVAARTVWPSRGEGGYRLSELAVDKGLAEAGWQEHDARGDAEMAAKLVEAMAERLRQHPPAPGGLLAAAGRASPTWQLVCATAWPGEPAESLEPDTARAAVARALARVPVLRRGDPGEADETGEGEEDGAPTREAIAVLATKPALCGADGRIDPQKLAVALHGGGAETRPAQQRCHEAVGQAAGRRGDALVEAPTGSGKSLVLLAAAIDWIAAAPGRRAVIATYTKQLQSQLLEALDGLVRAEAAEGLEEATDLVKGAANRLSLRALTAALATLASGRTARGAPSRSLTAQPAFADLCLWLLCRLAAAAPAADGTPAPMLHRLRARSTDPVDVPADLHAAAGGALPAMLAELSQARSGEWAPRSSGLAAHTSRVGEALAASPLVIANHALVASARDALDADDGELLLLCDEAHQLEDAATSALTDTVDTRALRSAAFDATEVARRLAQEPGGALEEADGADEGAAAVRRLREAARRLWAELDSGALSATIARALALSEEDLAGSGARSRTAMIADREADERQRVLARHLAGALGQVARYLSEAIDALGACRPLARRASGDLADAAALAETRLWESVRAVRTVRADLRGLAHPTDGGPAGDGDSPAAAAASREHRVVWAADDPPRGAALQRTLADDAPLRRWPLLVATSPVRLDADQRWQETTARFAARCFVSGTLTVAGDDPFAYIRRRLGLDEEAAATYIAADFAIADQALLMATTDFPAWGDWAEHAAATAAHQLASYLRIVGTSGHHGAILLTTATAAAGQIAERVRGELVAAGESRPCVHSGPVLGNQPAVEQFQREGGLVAGTRGLWQGVDVHEPGRLSLVWINKLPFAPVADPVVDARRRDELARARDAGHDESDAEHEELERYYLPMAALALRQAVGRLLRSRDHRGAVVISDPKLAGETPRARSYRRVLLGSLDAGWRARCDDRPEGLVEPMATAWQRIWQFLARHDVGAISPADADRLSDEDELESHLWPRATRRVRQAALAPDEATDARDRGDLAERVRERATASARALSGKEGTELTPKQQQAITALADGRDVLALLPTGHGKSWCYQLPALVLPGTAVVVSPLVSLMADQALGMAAVAGPAVRALTTTMRESNSRAGKAQVQAQLTGKRDHGIKLVYLAPERLANRAFQDQLRQAAACGNLSLLAFDEAHTLADWGETFRPAMRRAEHFVQQLRGEHPVPVLAATATATSEVRSHLEQRLLGRPDGACGAPEIVAASPLRSDLAVYKRRLPRGRADSADVLALAYRSLEACHGHAIVYATTVAEVEAAYGYLSAQLGRSRRVMRYHARLDPIEKGAVNDAFKQAAAVDDPAADGEEVERPMVVVATKAFGLGIDRPDVRLVLCLSPPDTDLAGLYQALGRAGRDQAGSDSEPHTLSAGAAVLTPRAWGLLQWMNRRRIPHAVITWLCETLLAVEGRADVQVAELAADAVDHAITKGLLPESAADDPYATGYYQQLVIRTFAELADRGCIDDLGDAPREITVRPTEALTEEHSPTGELATTLLEAHRRARPDRRYKRAQLVDVLAELPEPTRDEVGGDPGGLFNQLLELYEMGLLDVSQQGNPLGVTVLSYRVRSTEPGPDVVETLLANQNRRAEGLARLRDWFTDERSCVGEGLADEFAAADAAPADCCAHALARCSVCWQAHPDEDHPTLLAAFATPAAELAHHEREASAHLRQRTDDAVAGLLRHLGHPIGRVKLGAILRGEQRAPGRGGLQPLKPRLIHHRWFARLPGLTQQQLERSLERLITTGQVVEPPGDYRTVAAADARTLEGRRER